MKICGIVVEYNPLTNGHLHHIQMARQITQCDLLVAVMSGNFTQRGEPTIIDKWQRSKAAVLNGVDLVFELPFAFACESADFFSKGALAILNALGASSIVFGTETMNKYDFEKLYLESQTPQYQQRVNHLLKQGLSYPQATSLSFDNVQISRPNDLLGFAYVKEILTNQFPINYYTIERKTDYHSLQLTSLSASSLRKALKEGKDIHHYSPMHIDGYLHDIEELYEPLYHKLLFSSPEHLGKIHLMSEGLQYRMQDKILQSTNMASFLLLTTTRRYTTPRILRTIIHALINDTSGDRTFEEVGYCRLLAASTKGQKALKQLKKQCNLPIISNFSQISHPHLQLELQAAKLYASALDPSKRLETLKKEYTSHPFLLTNDIE